MIDIRIRKQLQFSGGKKNLSVQVVLKENNIIALYGESGAGKTTLLKIMAGLMTPEEGFIQVNNRIWLDTKQHINLPPQQRSIGFVFQDYALFPNMTVLQNIHYAAGKRRNDTFINQLIDTVSLHPFLHTKPSHLSGGQQQRVALIRALVRKPQLLLLDEPLSALDTTLRKSMHQALHTLQQQLSFTAILVSHDIGEVYTLAHHLIRLQEGNVVFKGTPQQLFGSESVSNNIQLTGEVIAVIPNGLLYIVEILAGTFTVRLTATADEIRNLTIGSTVLIYASTFHVRFKRIN